jgi:hypothetical protein
MSLTEARFEEQPKEPDNQVNLAADLLLDGIAQFPVRLTSGSMNDGDLMAHRIASTLVDPRLQGKDVDVGMLQDPTDPGSYIVTLTLSQVID